jgi:hypothetical protein
LRAGDRFLRFRRQFIERKIHFRPPYLISSQRAVLATRLLFKQTRRQTSKKRRCALLIERFSSFLAKIFIFARFVSRCPSAVLDVGAAKIDAVFPRQEVKMTAFAPLVPSVLLLAARKLSSPPPIFPKPSILSPATRRRPPPVFAKRNATLQFYRRRSFLNEKSQKIAPAPLTQNEDGVII